MNHAKLTCGRPLDDCIWSCYELVGFIHPL